MKIASKIDHTLLKPTATDSDILRLCQEAVSFGFYSVCIPPSFLNIAVKALEKATVKICTVAGFPLGYQRKESKLDEIFHLIQAGADEIDMVINIASFKTGKLNDVFDEIEQACSIVHLEKKLLKVIIETAYLNADEIRMICSICAQAQVDFVKTSTGFAPHGATVKDVSFIRSLLPSSIQIKASGGIKTYEDAIGLIKAGADRLGTSQSVHILNPLLEEQLCP